MRVISGVARGTTLQSLPNEIVRPTTSRVKEALFSILQFDLPNCVFLDLFSGSGQIGIEALSRGASSAVFIEQHPQAKQLIEQNLENAQLLNRAEIHFMEAQHYLKINRHLFDIAFLDPPYQQNLIPSLLPLMNSMIKPHGTIFCEHLADQCLPNQVGSFLLSKQYHYGRIMLSRYIQPE